MAYVKNEQTGNKYKVGDWAVTKRRLECFTGYFEKGTKVKVIGKGIHGYDLEDECGNQIFDTGYDSIE